MIAALTHALLLIGAAQADPAPSGSRWSVRVEPACCLLERRTAEPASTLSIDTVPGSDSYRLAIASRDLKGSASFVPAPLTFVPSRKTLKGFASTTKRSDGTPVIWMQGISPALLDDLTGAETIALAAGSTVETTVPVPRATAAVEALRRCTAEQLVDWGADAAQFTPDGMAPVALKDRDAWLSNSQLLAIARKSGRTAIDDDFRVTVSTDGVVDGCHAVAKVADAGQEKIACAAVMNKRLFTPARNAGGAPVRGAATFHVSLMRQPS